MRAQQISPVISYHGEGPVWDSDRNALRMVDMLAGDLLTVIGDAVQRRHVGRIAAVWRPRSGPTGGGVVALERGFGLIDADPNPDLDPGADDGEIHELPEIWTDPLRRMNEGGCDPQGRLYCGSMAYDHRVGAGSVYRLDVDGRVTTVLTDVTISNGIAWNPSGELVYYNDTTTQQVDVFDFEPTEGTLLNRRRFAAIDPAHGSPDGLTVDAEGGVWVALFGGCAVRRYAPNGTLDAVVDVNARQVTACTFGGPALDQIFITTSAENLVPADEPTAGALFHLCPGVPGMLPLPYGG